MTMIPFDPTKPALNAARDSATMRNQLNSLYNGDFLPLRVRAQASPNMTVQVASSDVESFWRQCWVGFIQALNYAGGNSPAITAPSTNPRIALLTIDSSGTLAWTYGAEAASPTPPDCPLNKLPLALIYERTAMAKIVNYEDAGSYPNDAYIYRDVRPLVHLHAGWSGSPISFPLWFPEESVGNWGIGIDAGSIFNGYFTNADHNLNDYASYKITLDAGIYKLYLLTWTTNNSAYCKIYLDGVLKGSRDLYTAATVKNQIHSSLEISIDTSGIKTFKFLAEAKHPSSSGYYMVFQDIALTRIS